MLIHGDVSHLWCQPTYLMPDAGCHPGLAMYNCQALWLLFLAGCVHLPSCVSRMGCQLLWSDMHLYICASLSQPIRSSNISQTPACHSKTVRKAIDSDCLTFYCLKLIFKIFLHFLPKFKSCTRALIIVIPIKCLIQRLTEPHNWIYCFQYSTVYCIILTKHTISLDSESIIHIGAADRMKSDASAADRLK